MLPAFAYCNEIREDNKSFEFSPRILTLFTQKAENFILKIYFGIFKKWSFLQVFFYNMNNCVHFRGKGGPGSEEFENCDFFVFSNLCKTFMPHVKREDSMENSKLSAFSFPFRFYNLFFDYKKGKRF